MNRIVSRALASAVVLSALASTRAAAQAVIVSGRVMSGGVPLAGAHVRIDDLNPKIDRVTNGEGRYTFVVPSSNVRGQSVRLIATMADRRVRYAPKSEVMVLTGTTIVKDFDLALVSAPAPVTPIASTQQSAGTQQSASTQPAAPAVPRIDPTMTDSTAFLDLTGAADIASALAGRVPGLIVVPPSTPGGSASLVFRGPRSALGSSQPVFVVDGVVRNTTTYTSPAQRFGLGGFDYGNALTDLDVADVASIRFVAGPEALGLIGGRGANGAVFVRTKSGADGPRFGITASYQTVNESFTSLPSFQNRYGQGLNGQFEFFNGKGGGVNDDVDQSWGPALDGRPVPQASYTEPGRPDVRLWSPRPNNVRDYFSSGRTSNILAAVQGHNEKASYRVFGGARDARGISPEDQAIRRNIGARVTARPVSRLEVSANVFGVESHVDDAPGTGFNEGNPFSQFMRMGRQVDVDSLSRHVRDSSGRQINWIYTGHNNPNFATLIDGNRARRYHTGGGTAASYSIAPWLTASARGGMDHFREHRLFSIASGWLGGFPSYTGPGDFSKGGGEGNEIFATQTTAAARLDAVRTISGLRWNFGFGLDLLGSRERIQTLGVDSIRHVPSAGAPPTATLPQVSMWSGHARETSALGEAGVTFSNGANIRAGLRNAWMSDVPGQHASSLLPSIATTVDLMRAFPSMRDCCFFSAATVRGSLWRDAGNLSPYVTQTMYAGRPAAGNVAPVGGSLLVADPSLAPELTTGVQVGGDVTLKARRISLGFTIYDERTSGVILPVSGATGLVAQNAGEVSNRGIEGFVTSRMSQGELGLQWDVTLNAGHNSNEVVSLTGSTQSIPLGPSQWGLSVEARPGLPLGALIGRRVLRDAGGTLLLRNGLPLPDSIRGAQYLGDGQGKTTLGIRNSLRYRWVSASIAADGRFGGRVYSGTNLWGSYAGTLDATGFRPDSGLLITGIDAASGRANATRVKTQDYYHALAAIQEPWVYSASFFKIRDARLTFTVPAQGASLPFQSASVSLVARNVYTWVKAPNIDPETIFSPYQLPGIEMGQLPTTRSFGVQLTVTP
jgi:hypothetical protein